MFALVYLLAVIAAAIPLGILLLGVGAGEAISLRQIYRGVLQIVGVFVGIVVLEIPMPRQ